MCVCVCVCFVFFVFFLLFFFFFYRMINSSQKAFSYFYHVSQKMRIWSIDQFLALLLQNLFLGIQLFCFMQVLVAWGISFLIPGAVVIRGPGGLRWLGGGRLLLHYVGRCLLPDACGYPVSPVALVNVSSEGLCFACQVLFITFFQTFGV